jgi:hypothetical protein
MSSMRRRRREHGVRARRNLLLASGAVTGQLACSGAAALSFDGSVWSAGEIGKGILLVQVNP